jgi:hypothetical protein
MSKTELTVRELIDVLKTFDPDKFVEFTNMRHDEIGIMHIGIDSFTERDIIAMHPECVHRKEQAN